MMIHGSAAYDILVILGPTATGKTVLAAHLAASLNGEVISADSRQVYRGMDIGTGKDQEDYVVNGVTIPVHLTDIADAGYQYNVYEYKRDFWEVMAALRARGKFPVLCGGSGLYIEAVLQDYHLIEVPLNEALRATLKGKSLEELTSILKTIKPKLHNITDIVNEKRAIRAIEIEEYYLRQHDYSLPPAVTRSSGPSGTQSLHPMITGIRFDVDTRRRRITHRLHQRLNNGMIKEVDQLLRSGIAPEALTYYGLEYKFITLYLTGELSLKEMTEKLNIAIHQFAKRQMTWFRKMERQGTLIHWIDGNLPLEEKVKEVIRKLEG